MAQIGTVKVETAGGPVELPVYELGDSGSNRVEAFRVQTASGPGFVPLTDVSAADRPYLRVQTANGVKAFDTSASGIPDSVVSRGADDNTASVSDKRGIIWDSDDDWPEIGAKISSTTSGFSEAYAYKISNGSLIDSKSISDLSSGDTFTLSGPFSADTEYSIVIDDNGSSYNSGFDEAQAQPYTSPDGRLRITDGAKGTGSQRASDTLSIVTIGNIGF